MMKEDATTDGGLHVGETATSDMSLAVENSTTPGHWSAWAVCLAPFAVLSSRLRTELGAIRQASTCLLRRAPVAPPTGARYYCLHYR